MIYELAEYDGVAVYARTPVVRVDTPCALVSDRVHPGLVGTFQKFMQVLRWHREPIRRNVAPAGVMDALDQAARMAAELREPEVQV